MNATRQLHDLGQSFWLDNITRGLLTSGTLLRYFNELSMTGLTSNPTIFDHAINDAGFYDDAIRQKALAGESGEALFFELALEDLTQAADLFRSIHDATAGVDGWASLEVSPLLADDTAGTIKAAARLHARAQRSNLFIKIPGTAAGIPAIEETIFAGVSVSVTLLFSREHYIAAAEAYMRGIERRIAAGRDARVASVASIFVSRWDVAAKDKVPDALRNCLGIAMAMRTYQDYRDLLASQRWRKLANSGARPQRLLRASTGTKDPAAPDVLYVETSMSRPTPTTRSTAPAQGLTERPAWKALEVHCATIRNLHLRQLFADDPRRGERLSAEAAGIYLDYSKNRITDETIRLLVRLAEACGLRERIAAMFRGERINVTETRAALHTALRGARDRADSGQWRLFGRTIPRPWRLDLVHRLRRVVIPRRSRGRARLPVARRPTAHRSVHSETLGPLPTHLPATRPATRHHPLRHHGREPRPCLLDAAALPPHAAASVTIKLTSESQTR